jgi:hypothetical protein
LGKLTTASAATRSISVRMRSVARIVCSACEMIHVIEGIVLEAGQPALDVHLDHIDPVANTAENAFMVDFDPVATDIPGLAQVAQQSAVTAAQVENTLAGRNPAGNHGKVEALPLLGPDSPLVLGHTAMFSR